MTSNPTIDRPTTDKLRADIDRGRTGDKVPASDPAAAPLGTDEEAAGTPIPPQAIAHAHAQETATSARMPAGQSAHPAPDRSRSRSRTALIVVVALGIVIAILLAITA